MKGDTRPGRPKDGGQGKEYTRVVWRTLARRGKSLTPESRIEILDERSWFVDCREETQEESADAIVASAPVRNVLHLPHTFHD